MKTLKRISLILFSTALFFSCDKIDELTEFDVNGNFTATIPVAISKAPMGGAQSFEQSSSINIADDPEIQDNLNSIENVTINSLSYELKDYSGASGAIVTNVSISFGSTVISLSDLNVEQLDNDNVVITITDVAALNAIGATLVNTPSITITLLGTIDQSPATFTTEVKGNFTVTIDAG